MSLVGLLCLMLSMASPRDVGAVQESFGWETAEDGTADLELFYPIGEGGGGVERKIKIPNLRSKISKYFAKFCKKKKVAKH